MDKLNNMDNYQLNSKKTAQYERLQEEYESKYLHDLTVLVKDDLLNKDILEFFDKIFDLMRLSYVTLGVTSEAGEIAGKVKKILRGDNGGVVDDSAVASLEGEIGDVLWYIANTCSELGLKMSETSDKNLKKLFDRLERNVIKGSGDNR